MKKFITLILAIPLIAVSCNKDNVQTSPEPDPEPVPESYEISFSISSTGFSAADTEGETVSITEFSEGDACGLYIINSGKAVKSNIRLVASKTGDILVWNPEDGEKLIYEKDDRYFLYYPYQENSYMEGKIPGNISETLTEEQLFAELAAGWAPSSDQSDQVKFSASDLMIAEGITGQEEDGTVPVIFGMTHRMALAVINKPQTVYDFGEDYPRDYTVTYDPTFPERGLLEYNGKYYCLVRPETASEIEISFGNGEKKTADTGNIEAGACRSFEFNETVSSTLSPGDFYCRADDGKGYIVPQEAIVSIDNDTQVIGVVFYKGLHEKDNLSDYTRSLPSGGAALGNTVHGYAVALTDANNGDSDQLKWSSKAITKPDDANYTLDQGTSTDNTDWNGYYNCCKIYDFVTGYAGSYTITDFPAALAACTYGNWTVDADGQPTEDYGWQNRFIAPADCSGWYLPSAGQLTAIHNQEDLLTGQIEKINAIVTDGSREHIRWITSISRYVWSSTEYKYSPSRSAYAVYFNGGSANWQNKYGNSNIYAVRPVLAF